MREEKQEQKQENSQEIILIPIIDDNSIYEIFIPAGYKYILALFSAFGFDPRKTLESGEKDMKQYIVIENIRMLNKFLENISILKGRFPQDRLIRSIHDLLQREKVKFKLNQHSVCRVVGNKYYIPVAIYFTVRK